MAFTRKLVQEIRTITLYFSGLALRTDNSTGEKQEGNYIQQKSRKCLLSDSFLARVVLYLTVQVVPHTRSTMDFISDLNKDIS